MNFVQGSAAAGRGGRGGGGRGGAPTGAAAAPEAPLPHPEARLLERRQPVAAVVDPEKAAAQVSTCRACRC